MMLFLEMFCITYTSMSLGYLVTEAIRKRIKG